MTEKKPTIRFKGFDNDWEQRKLGEVAKDISDGDWIEKEHIFDDGEYRIIQTGNLGEGEYLDKPNNAKYFYQKDFDEIKANEIFAGDLLISRLAEPAGRTIILPATNHRMVTAVDVTIIRPDDSFDSTFLMTQMNSSQTLNKVGKSVSGTSHKRISRKNLEKINLLIPSLNEQKRIGSFFKQLDHTITLHQQQLENLKKAKKGYLQKMFPKNNEKVPEIRFEGFTDDWEQRKFAEVIEKIQTGTNLLGSTENSGTPLLKMGNIQRGYWSLEKLEYLSKNEIVEVDNVVQYGDFFFNTRNTLELVGKGATWLGESGKYAFNSNIARFEFNGIDTVFFNYLYSTEILIKQVHARAVGTTSVAAVYPRDLNSLEFRISTIEEQIKIGSFFKQLDDTITLHQRKLDYLKEMKKGLLQKMFV
ncbi:restriction endonuclease subunit S [Enterococcus canintestini]|uniref:restriction endonuclease subunit S n=1 Tax=Enterococcus canintestini TaxID=317010 RepID=UPI0015DA5C16|nr:restriction endonuclease subunit S [Enterococcus canintestini]